MAEITKERLDAALQVFKAVADCIREVKEVPSGELYARLMQFLTFEQYSTIIDQLKKAKVISESNHVLKWEGK